jgi:hypothetical protein
MTRPAAASSRLLSTAARLTARASPSVRRERKSRQMTETQPTDRGPATGRSHRRVEPVRTAWVGWIMFAGVMMILIGTFEAMAGLVALLNDQFYLVRSSGLVLSLDYTAWGWLHLLLGIVIAAAGLGVMVGKMWARIVGVVVALLSAIANMAFLPAYPVMATLIIAIDVLVIYALTAHGKETKSSEYV